MSDVIATVWDFDKTLIPGYMQDPIFDYFKFSGKQFWDENKAEIETYENQDLTVNHDTYYLNKFIRMSQPGHPFDGLNNALLKELGGRLQFYEGALDLFKKVCAYNDNVSTGFKRMIEGSAIFPFVKKIWGAELIDSEGADGKTRLTEVAYSLDNTTKTRALFEINKGVGIIEGANIDVNSKIPMEKRRVQFCNMIYVADGPSDVPAFSVINQNFSRIFQELFGGGSASIRRKAQRLPSTPRGTWRLSGRSIGCKRTDASR